MESTVTTTEERLAQKSLRPSALVSDRVSWGTVFKYVGAAIGILLLLLLIVDKVAMPWYVKLGSVEMVPDVSGKSFVEAQDILEKDGFEVKKGEQRFSDKYPPGTVMMQLPYGGSQTKEGRRIFLTVSRGSELTPMLDLVGMPLREARIALMRQGFDIGETSYEYNDTIMRDLIFSQSIPSRVGARPGSIVNVVISKGPSTRFTMMPNLIALDVETARVRVENAGLVLGIIRNKESNSYIPNTVIEQAVAPYAQVAEDAAIDITIATREGSNPEGALLKTMTTAPPQSPSPILPKAPEPKPRSAPKSSKSPK